MSAARAADPDPARLRALAENLGQTPQAIAGTLYDELRAARAQIDAGLAGEDLVAVGDGAHAARNSALMVGAKPLLTELRALETAADAGELAAAREAQGRAEADLAHLIEALGELV
ncbi:MAG TPA: hypothetical protein VGL69_08340 [Solirubrobacteraceae bacterium]